MNLIINNTPVDTDATTLAQLCEQRQLPAKGVAVAVDNKMVPRAQWASFELCEGQKVTILKAFCGG